MVVSDSADGRKGVCTIPRWLSGLLAILLLFSAQAACAESVEIITSPDRAGIPLNRNLLRALFTMRIGQWPDGRPVHVFVLPDNNEIHDLFCRERLGTYPYVLRDIWDRKVYTGTGLAPTEVQSEDEMKQVVKSTPGAIGYVGSKHSSSLPAPLPAAASHIEGGPRND